MMKINDLFKLGPDDRRHGSLSAMNPLSDEDALQEAQVLDVRFDVLTGAAGVLFELRQALQLQEANTGVLIVSGVRELAWSGPSRRSGLTAWSVGSSVPQVRDRLTTLDLAMWPHPGARLKVSADSAAFFVGDVPGLAEAPPDYTGRDRAALGRKVADWDSPFDLVSAVFSEPA